MEIVKIDSMEDLKAYALEVTRKARNPEPEPEPEPKPERSELARSLLSVWDKADFGCQSVHVAQILRVILKAQTGEDVEFKDEEKKPPKKYTYPLFSVIVPDDCPNSHSYPIGSPFLVSKKGVEKQAKDCVRINGQEGNNHGGEWHYASDEEIDDYFSAMAALGKSVSDFE